jgi:hypothetical protein
LEGLVSMDPDGFFSSSFPVKSHLREIVMFLW